jgi:hypothetical protein
VYESALEKLTCIGAGTMVVEDYRKPEEKPGPAQSPLPGADVARPSQSVFTWSRSMDLSQKDRIANLAGKVAMVHRSGNEVVLTKRLKVRPWGELPSGRNMKMHCDRMFAEFAPPEPGEGARGGDALTGPRVGPLELFRARAAGREYVRIFNPPIEVFCRRVLYQRARDIAIVYGHLENEPPRNALIYRKDPTRRRLDVMEESSKIIWRPSTNRVEARGVKVTGTM